jgi:hypothetical protein
MDSVFTIEEYISCEGTTTLGIYTDKAIAREKLCKFLASKQEKFTLNEYYKLNGDEWVNEYGTAYYYIAETKLNQDI